MYAILAQSVFVLPDPAPAMIRRGESGGDVTAGFENILVNLKKEFVD
jgi:hypothetical protein